MYVGFFVLVINEKLYYIRPPLWVANCFRGSNYIIADRGLMSLNYSNISQEGLWKHADAKKLLFLHFAICEWFLIVDICVNSFATTYIISFNMIQLVNKLHTISLSFFVCCIPGMRILINQATTCFALKSIRKVRSSTLLIKFSFELKILSPLCLFIIICRWHFFHSQGCLF